ncbi:GGDEF domain-containing protein [Pediococcus ethanolidurans]|uniref:GGDEF domain-containing protein n=1 Tax=Pediococcus ethanolidurans TaxID=319653 RepID=UPI001C1E94AD|nr:GGDEF domain-containing protein [Pediococcus ethanolidurans]MBU7554104.1 GGDEF domain-containing protein [Pediococcus ethanolidurans]MCV3314625.1 GGDEF domain-containing protein [Pediococcus ethanolidurans]MCV3321210.1 GGDEF domain-containing protein [Pediococcus ethanolidurans]MCV3323674.1 GGDEF domain-containing protein [Pediococcus ethanolidurans]MCV3326614.1 GGDEF domain-containing protein [Pediococcus ethanolidurans]
MTSNDDQKSVLYTDVCLLLFLALIGIMAILMALTGHVLLNTIFLFCTLAVLLITYFFGIIASLITNLGFIALQTIIVIYQYLDGTQTIPWGLTYWMILPLLLSVTLYFMTKNQVKLQKINGALRANIIEQGAFDDETKLRTTVAYMEDAAVFIETNKRFKLPVTTIIVKIRYFNDLKRMMGPEQLRNLLKLTSNVIKQATRDNDITYLLNNEDPTWAILLFTDTDGAQIAANRIKQVFDKQLNNSSLASLAIAMVVGVATLP